MCSWPWCASGSRSARWWCSSGHECSKRGHRPRKFALVSVSAGDLGALAAITDAVEAGAGLPEILRIAARALNASLILIDRSGVVLAVAARSTADERSLMRATEGVQTIELRVAEATVGQLRLRARDRIPDPTLLRLVTALVASEVDRVRAPERASDQAAISFQRAVLAP